MNKPDRINIPANRLDAIRRLRLFFLTICLLVQSIVMAEDGTLVIVTSFPETLFNPFRIAFSKKYPDTEITILNKKTTAALSALTTSQGRGFDIFWASSPDAFEVLKNDSLLALQSNSVINDPDSLNGYPLSDPDGYYAGFAISGYGMMWNRDYLHNHQLQPPASWADLTRPEYAGHVGITSPSRSGTTHLIIEMILQSQGWENGWAMLLQMAGNLATITARSYGVPDGIVAQRFGIGPVIDFFALSARASGEPVSFAYDPASTLLPASIAILKNATHQENARRFVDFVLSESGQRILFEPSISRLPLQRSMYAEAPPEYPDPYRDTLVNENNRFDIELSRQRYQMVNGLFDQLITFRLKDTRRVWKSINSARRSLTPGMQKTNKDLLHLLDKASQIITQVPVSMPQSVDAGFASIFSQRKPGLPVSAKQGEMEAQWSRERRAHLLEAARLVKQVPLTSSDQQ